MDINAIRNNMEKYMAFMLGEHLVSMIVFNSWAQVLTVNKWSSWWSIQIQIRRKKVEHIQSQYNGWISWPVLEVRYSSACWCIWKIQKDLFTILQTWHMFFFYISRKVLNAMLKMTDVKLELMTDIDMFQFIEKWMKGGSHILPTDMQEWTMSTWTATVDGPWANTFPQEVLNSWVKVR